MHTYYVSPLRMQATLSTIQKILPFLEAGQEESFHVPTRGHAFLVETAPLQGGLLWAYFLATHIPTLAPHREDLLKGSFTELFASTDQGQSFTIAEAKQVRSRVTLSSERPHVVIIENIERMTTEAANALLKTIEEPDGTAYFFCTTSHPSQVLSTLSSRMVRTSPPLLGTSIISPLLGTLFPERTHEDIGTINRLAGNHIEAFLYLAEAEPEELKHAESFAAHIPAFFEHNPIESMQGLKPLYDKDTTLPRWLCLFLLEQYIEKNQQTPTVKRQRTRAIRQVHLLREALSSNGNKKLACLHATLS